MTESEMDHYILAGWLIDGSGEKARRRQLLTVSDGLVDAISPADGADLPDPTRLTDLSHCTVVPPLLDSHLHLCMSGSIDQAVRQAQQRAGCHQLRGVIDEHLRQLFGHGVLVVRDGGDRLGCLENYCPERTGGGEVLIKRSGKAYFRQGRYGSLIGGRPIETETLAERWEQDGQQVDQIKVVNSGLNSLHEFGRETRSQFSTAELAALVARAHARGQKVMVHANGRLPVRAALDAGCDSVEHGYFMGRENLELMAERGIFWVPTMYTMKAYGDYADAYRGMVDRRVIEKTLDHQLEQVAFARRCGVRVALGTDAGSAGVLHGESVVEEMKLLIKAGYRLEEAIRCATEENAALLGVERQWGRIARAKPAHFLVTRGTPAQLPRKLSYLEAIYLGGRPAAAYHR
jgi:imidazolonepropionase-like amidohydrolase